MQTRERIVSSLSSRDRLLFYEYAAWSLENPEIKNLKGCLQDTIWHPEGDAFTHTYLVLQAARLISIENRLNDADHLVLMASALCHDFGKPEKTALMPVGSWGEDLKWTSYGHEEAGVPLADEFLSRIGLAHIRSKVLPLVENHLAHRDFSEKGNGGPRTARRLAARLSDSSKGYDATIRELCMLMQADISGRPFPGEVIEIKGEPAITRLLSLAQSINADTVKMVSLVTGEDIMRYGIAPGPEYGVIKSSAMDAQEKGILNEGNKEEWLHGYMIGRIA